ncbi:replication factor A [Haloplanus halophilus]|uniref:replication factor A n=1 Tax=Haloplanus halophilus TaxID=2949993 RepID=UPI002041D4B9|nr:replication factor A [Haloplanus sp. GDY1]
MNTLREDAQLLHEQVAPHLPDDRESDYGIDALETLFDSYVNTYRVPRTAAFDSVRNHVLKEAQVDAEAFWASLRSGDQGTTDDPLPLAECTTDGAWVTVRAKIVEHWDPREDSIHQVGLIGDESGRLKFVAWAKSNPPILKEGTTYTFKDVVVDEYDGNYSLKINSRSEIIEHAADSPEAVGSVGTMTTVYDGVFVAMQSQSGLIKRCTDPECTRVIQQGECSEHGPNGGEFDLRIKGVLDDGESVQECLFTAGLTEVVTGIDLEEAKQIASDALDISVVERRLTELLIGRRYTVEGPILGRYLLVDDVSESPNRTFAQGYHDVVDDLLSEYGYDGPGLTAENIEDLPETYDAPVAAGGN